MDNKIKIIGLKNVTKAKFTIKYYNIYIIIPLPVNYLFLYLKHLLAFPGFAWLESKIRKMSRE